MPQGPEKPTVITVMGTGRSGTSLITMILHTLGVYLGPDEFFMAPTPANPKGYYELQPICRLNNEILAQLGGNCWEPPHFPKGWEKSPVLAEQRIKLQAILKTVFGGSRIWGWKDPRSCWTLPFWSQFLPPLRHIFALRNPLDVAASLKESEGLDFHTAVTYWHRALCSALQNSTGQERLLVFYDDIMESWERELGRIAKFIGKGDLVNYPKVRGAVSAFVEKKLHRNRSSLASVISDSKLPFTVKALYMTLRSMVNGGGDARALRGISPNPFEKILDMFGHQSLRAQEEVSRLVERSMSADRKSLINGAFDGTQPALRVSALAAKLAAMSGGKDGSPRIEVSIIIPVHGRKDFTKKCLEQLFCNTPLESQFEIIVVDNASLDDTPALLQRARRIYPRLRVFTQIKNLGFAAACNQGAEAAAGEFLLFLNNDTEVQRGWLEPLVRVLKEDERVVGVGSKLLYPNKRIQHAGVVAIDDRQTGDPLVARAMYNGLAHDAPEANEPRTYQALTAACLLVRKSAFDAVGRFDEEFWNGYEDVDLCFRLQEAGGLLVYQPESVVIHHEAQSGPERFRRVQENIERLHSKWLNKVKPDFVIDSGGMLAEVHSGRIKPYKCKEPSPGAKVPV